MLTTACCSREAVFLCWGSSYATLKNFHFASFEKCGLLFLVCLFLLIWKNESFNHEFLDDETCAILTYKA